ncbi:MAG: pyridoxamine 5'-phosphate oxidase family protein [Candidatus Coproplasma sp.]
MRKSNREIKEFNKIIEILDRCQVIRLGLHDKDYPYIVPLSFGWEVSGGKLNLYFHCAKEGKKLDLIAANGKVCVEADILNGYKPTEKSVTADYESIIAFGTAEEVIGDEAIHGIKLLLDHCGISGYSPEDCVLTKIVAVYKISVDTITGKKRFL